MFTEPMPDCVPEFYRSRQEDADHKYESQTWCQAHYLANRQKIAAAIASGLPVLDFGGHSACQDCLDADHDTMTNGDDDLDRVICRDPACPLHRKPSIKGGITMNRYAELKQRQQQEFATFPMQFAFSDKQFAEAMAALGLEPTDTDKVYKAPGGGIYRREDGPRLKEMMDRFDRELQEAIDGDETGDGFTYEMFQYEMRNHEYGYTMDLDETLDALGYTLDEVQADPRLSHGLEKARTEILGGD